MILRGRKQTCNTFICRLHFFSNEQDLNLQLDNECQALCELLSSKILGAIKWGQKEATV